MLQYFIIRITSSFLVHLIGIVESSYQTNNIYYSFNIKTTGLTNVSSFVFRKYKILGTHLNYFNIITILVFFHMCNENRFLFRHKLLHKDIHIHTHTSHKCIYM